MHILFVDDEKNLLKALERTLRLTDWDVDFALSGPEALLKIEDGHYDVIVTDMAMPAMKGDRLLREVKAVDPNITRIILSGHAEQSLSMEDDELAHRWIDKPCDPDYLMQVLQELDADRRLD